MNLYVDVFLRPEDRDAWSVAVDDLAARVVVRGDIGFAAFHWPGADGRTQAVRMLREVADQLEAAP